MERIKKLIAILTLVSLLGVVLFLFFLFGGSWLDELKLHQQVIRVTYQFFLVVVFGGGVSWLYQELTRKREQNKQDRTEFLSLFSDLVKVHNESKAIKRLLRAKAWRKKEEVDVLLVEPYIELMDRLNKVQLDSEAIKRHVKSKNKFFAKVNELYQKEKAQDKEATDTIHGDLSRIEKYLNKIVQEYETALREYSEPPRYLRLDQLESVEAFIAAGDDASEFRIDAKARFKSAIKKLSQVADSLEI